MNAYRPELCAISSVDLAGYARLDCLDVLAWGRTRTIGSYVQEADQMMLGTFLLLVAIVTIFALALAILKLRPGSVPSAIRPKAPEKMVLRGSLPFGREVPSEIRLVPGHVYELERKDQIQFLSYPMAVHNPKEMP